MRAKPRTVLGDLADWDLPSLDHRLDQLIEVLQRKKLKIVLDADSLGEQLHAQLWDPVRKLGATAANEAIAGWMQGHADGCPNLCVSFAYLDGEAEAQPLTLVYTVGARDGKRMELRRVDLEKALHAAVQFDHATAAELNLRRRRAKSMAMRLRELAEKIDPTPVRAGASPFGGPRRRQ